MRTSVAAVDDVINGIAGAGAGAQFEERLGDRNLDIRASSSVSFSTANEGSRGRQQRLIAVASNRNTPGNSIPLNFQAF